MNDKKSDLICSTVFILFGVFLLIATPLMTTAYKNDALGSRFFPYAIATCTILIAGLQGTAAILAIRKAPEKEKYQIAWGDNLRTILFCLSAAIAVILIDKVHFLAGAFVMTTAMLLLCKERHIVRYAIVYVCCLAAYFIFTLLLKVRI
jgi:Ca2+/Na+ antiporter